MVRLRTDRWYTSDGQRRSRTVVKRQAMGNRRLISLCFLLALVIMLMQRAADPKYITSAFKSLGVPFGGQSLTDRNSDDQRSNEVNSPDDRTSAQTESAKRSEGSPSPQETPRESESPAEAERGQNWKSTVQDLVPRLLGQASETELEALATIWFKLPTKVNLAVRQARLASLNTNTLEKLKQIQQDMKAADDDPWRKSLSQFEMDWRELWANIMATDPSTDGGNSFLLQTVSDHLDIQLIASLRDGSPWQKVENAAFQRLLARCQKDAEKDGQKKESIALISTQQLQTERKELKGKTIRFQGSVRRVTTAERTEESPYWLVWIRGKDDSPQPVALYTCDPIASEWKKRLEGASQDFPEIEIEAISAKRLAYASTSGLEIAPTLFATKIVSTNAPTLTNDLLQPTPDIKNDFRKAVWIGIGLALLFILPVWYQWRNAPVARSKSKLKYRSPSSSSQSSKLVLLCFIPCLGISATAMSQEKPPWAQEASVEDQREQALKMLLERAFSGNAKQRLDQFLFGDTESVDSFPDVILRCTQSIEKIGWKNLAPSVTFDLAETGVQLKQTSISGFVRLAMPVSLNAEQTSWFLRRDEERFYRLAVIPEGQERIIWVFARSVPSLWTSSASLYQPVEIAGFAIGTEQNPTQCMIARDLRWTLPEANNSELLPLLKPEYVALGQAGWNLAWIERIQQNDQKPLQMDESAAFYSLIQLAGNPDGKLAVTPDVTGGLQPMEAIGEPKTSFGKEASWRVRLVHGSRIEIAPKHVELLGQKYYYQFDGFVDIGARQIGFRVAGETEIFQREFPITIVTCSDSQFVPKELLEQGTHTWEVGKYARVPGRFFRMWSFESDRVQKHSEQARQAAPLFIASQLTLAPPPAPQSRTSEIGWFGYALCITTLAILGAILFLASQKDRRRSVK